MHANKPLGEFLRSHRLRLEPERFGIRRAGTRRTPGLRREEVAERAGISTEWYVKLEQGRAAGPSGPTIAALGRALGLDELEMQHQRGLASGAALPAFAPESVPDALRRMVDQYPGPAYITGERWDILAFNTAADALFAFGRCAHDERNILVYMLGEDARAVFGAGWLREAKRIVALFRPAYDRRRGDPAFEALVERLHGAHPAFGDWWRDHRIDTPVVRTKALHPGGAGACVHYDLASFQWVDHPALRLALYTPQA
ncbi:helix-turn-helix domain-containing protein [Massilia sp. TN1-12]|uniref:helix-turn-helix domain-containing protein n=1 Tax=Massilia paldalensis TaxID=3377675 RepID=UPI00384A5BFC